MFTSPDQTQYLRFSLDQMVYTVRQRCGRQLAIEAPTNADVVSTVPESATPAALGYAQQSGLPYIEVLCKNRYVGRTFIQPNTRLRQLGVAKKFGALTDNFAGKRVVLIDDSIVRGNTISPIIKLLKEAGATEVHIRVASPPIRYPCYMGINIPTKEELIANKPEFQDIAGYIGADSVQYLTVEGLILAVQGGISSKDKDEMISNNKSSSRVGHCTACLTGKYPVELEW
ncbi:amidophosphoribosyltransferase [Periophthalmus magnuspinnatus]|uniref:amidophosphoribosyltransferase n=1 Tax=Periophthalmus magnuspinnatus TaxID=409849 RepID=UPI0024366CD2|nr:amidophosphoribosyltransferase [Periophthalmus magnuspinnatus]